MSCCECYKKLLKMSKFPNHYILKLFQKFRENFFQNFLSKLTVIYDYVPDIYLKFLITQLILKIFPKYRKNFLKVARFKSFLTVSLNFLRISKHTSVSLEFCNTYKFPQNFRIPFSSNYFPMQHRPHHCVATSPPPFNPFSTRVIQVVWVENKVIKR